MIGGLSEVRGHLSDVQALRLINPAERKPGRMDSTNSQCMIPVTVTPPIVKKMNYSIKSLP